MDKIKHYKKRLEEIKKQEVIKNQIVFVGDCLVERFELPKMYEGYTLFNHGIEGDTTIELLETLYKRVIKYKPAGVVISIGGHDLKSRTKVKEVYERMIEIVETIKKRSKDTAIYLFSVVPVNIAHEPFIDREMVEDINNVDVELLNYYVKNFARKNGITYMDITRELKNDFNQLALSYTIDGFHLNQKGYQIVKNILSSYV
ncbi:MAG: SGNH/GDSL hydrolase family protein [Candidatus Izemoplasmataceae bacterium]